MADAPNRFVARHKWLSLYVGYRDEPYVECSPGVMMVPLTEAGDVLCIIERTVPLDAPLLALPGGALDDGESPADSANREMQEEAGYRAGRVYFLGKLTPLGKHALWDIHLFLGRDLIPSRLEGDEGYEMGIERVPLARFETLIAAGRLADSTVIAALFMARHFLEREAQHG